MRIVVDTNIIIRMIIKADGVVAELFYSLKNKNEIYASSASLEEINKHKLCLVRASKLSRADFEELYTKVISHISIVPLSIIPTSFFSGLSGLKQVLTTMIYLLLQLLFFIMAFYGLPAGLFLQVLRKREC